jgi:Peptidase family M28
MRDVTLTVGRVAVGGCVLILALLFGACARQSDVRFSVENARAHVEMLAGTIGSRPAGSSNNAKARAYLIDQLRVYGFDVRVQETDAVRPEFGLTARVANIIAIKAGSKPDAIGLVAHYDSVPEAPGALDDGLGVAVCLEAARVLSAQQGRTNSLMVILTDGEELNLMGAAAVVTDADVTGRLRAYVNVEATGADGASFLFESGPRGKPLLEAWAAAAPAPRGSAYTTEIYKRLPNDTDFSIFKRHDIPGLNFAPVLDSYAYHTSRDTPERLRSTTIRHTGESVVATVAALDRLDLATLGTRSTSNRASAGAGAGGAGAAGVGSGAGDVMYFDTASRRAFVYSPFLGRMLAIVSVLIAVAAWVRVLRFSAARGATEGRGVLGLVVSFIWALLIIAAAIGAMLGAAWLLRQSREVFHPWYAYPTRFLLFLIAAGITVPWYLTRLMHFLPIGLQSLRAPTAVWALILPIWAALAAAIEFTAPAASHLWVFPLLTASVLLLVVPLRLTMIVRIVSLIAAAISALFWMRDAFDLYLFIVPLMGRLRIVTPFWLYPAYIAFAGIMLAPPIVAAAAGAIRGRRAQTAIGASLLLALAISTGLSYVADAYTPDRPLRRVARYVHDITPGQAWWDVGGNEPGLDLSLSASEAAQWRLQQADAVAPVGASVSPLIPPLGLPYVFRAPAPPAPAPADVVATFASKEGATQFEITIVPKLESMAASIALPAGVEPTQANLSGRREPRSNRWVARFGAIPTSGIAFRATVPAALAGRLSETVVILTANHGPAVDQPRVPAFLPQQRTEWQVQSRWIVQPPLTMPAPIEAPPALPGTPAPPPTPPR